MARPQWHRKPTTHGIGDGACECHCDDQADIPCSSKWIFCRNTNPAMWVIVICRNTWRSVFRHDGSSGALAGAEQRDNDGVKHGGDWARRPAPLVFCSLQIQRALAAQRKPLPRLGFGFSSITSPSATVAGPGSGTRWLRVIVIDVTESWSASRSVLLRWTRSVPDAGPVGLRICLASYSGAYQSLTHSLP